LFQINTIHFAEFGLLLIAFTLNDAFSQKSVFGEPLKICSTDPMTGYTRDGRCAHIVHDRGTHTVCAEMTKEFLDYTASMGNNLSDPIPQYGFPGLNPGDRWCLCASRWAEAFRAGIAPKVVLEATNKSTLNFGITEGALRQHSTNDSINL